MKKFICLLLTFILILPLNSCESYVEKNEANISHKGYEVALVTDANIETTDDSSYNAGVWDGIVEYCLKNNLTYKSYHSEKMNTRTYVKKIKEAIRCGAKLVICPGYAFEEAVFIEQDEYPDIKFVLIDGRPHDADFLIYNVAHNTMALLFKEDQAGFLAGYSAVKDGYKNLGFIGGISVPAVIRYGSGYVQGIEYAAQELGVRVKVKYYYDETFDASKRIEDLATNWYNEGCECIFACGGSVGNSVMTSAEKANKNVIGVDIDQSKLSKTVITSAKKELKNAVYGALESYYEGPFQGGRVSTLTVLNDGVGIEIDNSRFNKFTEDDYFDIVGKIKREKVLINDNTDDKKLGNLKLKLFQTTIEYIDKK